MFGKAYCSTCLHGLGDDTSLLSPHWANSGLFCSESEATGSHINLLAALRPSLLHWVRLINTANHGNLLVCTQHYANCAIQLLVGLKNCQRELPFASRGLCTCKPLSIRVSISESLWTLTEHLNPGEVKYKPTISNFQGNFAGGSTEGELGERQMDSGPRLLAAEFQLSTGGARQKTSSLSIFLGLQNRVLGLMQAS